MKAKVAVTITATGDTRKQLSGSDGGFVFNPMLPGPYYWFIVPDQDKQRNRFQLGIPYLGSIGLTHSLEGRVEGLRNTPRDLQPRMGMVFYAFRIMYGLAMVSLLSEQLHYGCASAGSSLVPGGSFGFWYS
jgi:cytochrome bd-type quinol oxidase subunit 1